MVLNFLIIAFLIGMFVLWSQYGLFSALIHLAVTIVAGTLALALWEPLAHWMLGTQMVAAHFAWGVGLLLPFALLLVGLRLASDRLVRANVVLPNLVNKAGGGVVGLFAAILTAGLVVIGLGFLPLPVELAGYHPLAISPATGKVQKTDSSLWVPVNQIAEGVFTSLSAGAFSSSKPLAEYRPDLARQSALFRLRPDANSSTIAVPGTVQVEEMFVHPTLIDGLPKPIATALGSEFKKKSNQLVVIHTKWLNNKPGTFTKGTLRLAPQQIRLATMPKGDQAGQDPSTRLIAPVAFRGKGETELEQNYFYPINSDHSVAYGFNQEEHIRFVFIIKADRKPAYLLARSLRLPLPHEPSGKPKDLLAALGKPAPQPKAEGGEEGDHGISGNDSDSAKLGPGKGIKVGSVGDVLEVTNKLPEQISKNKATSLTYNDASVVAGQDTAERGGRSISQRRIVRNIENPSHKSMVRLRLGGDRAHSLFGAARASAAQANPVFVLDNRGNRVRPFAYVWQEATGGTQHINVKDFGFFESGKQIDAINRMSDDDKLYLYFRVNPGVEITKYKVGDVAEQNVSLRVPD